MKAVLINIVLFDIFILLVIFTEIIRAAYRI